MKEGKVASVRVVVRVEVAKAKEVMAAAAAVVWATVEAAKVEEVKAVVAAERLVAEVVQAKAGVVAMVPVTVGAKWAVVEEAAEEVIAAVKKELVEMVVGSGWRRRWMRDPWRWREWRWRRWRRKLWRMWRAPGSGGGKYGGGGEGIRMRAPQSMQSSPYQHVA